MSDDLVAFLRARLAEDEQAARATAAEWGAVWTANEEMGAVQSDTGADVIDEAAPIRYIARHDPERVLAEVEAKRAMVELHRAELIEVVNADRDERSGYWCTECDGEEYPCRTLRLLAAPYAGHKDYRPEWAPGS